MTTKFHKSISVLVRTVCAMTAVSVLAAGSFADELTTNGDFETGDTSGWTVFTGGAASFTAVGDAASGSFAGLLDNPNAGTGEVVKQANIGAGVVTPFETITISFDAKANLGPGGVVGAVLFSELSGGGVSDTDNLSLAGINVTYQNFSYTVETGADVSGGITLQFNASTGAFAGSTAALFIDNVSVANASTVPEPGMLALLGLSSAGMLFRRRR